MSDDRKRRSGRSSWMRLLPRRRPRGPRRRDLLRQRAYWLRAGEVPKARVEVDHATASRFDRFDAFRAQHTGGRELPVELYVVLQRDGPDQISVWTLPSEAVEASHIGHLSEVDVPDYKSVLDRMTGDQTPMACSPRIAKGPAEYAAVVEGLPSDWSIPDPEPGPLG